MNLSEKVKYVRAKLLISQKELAKLVGVSFATINRWESGRLEPTFLSEKKFENFCDQKGLQFDKSDNK